MGFGGPLGYVTTALSSIAYQDSSVRNTIGRGVRRFKRSGFGRSVRMHAMPWEARNAKDFLHTVHLGDPLYAGLINPRVKDAARQREGLRRQAGQQRAATASTISQGRRAEEAQRKANARTPNVAAILATALDNQSGVASTYLRRRPSTLGQSSTLG